MGRDNQARNHHWVPQCYLKGFAKSRGKSAKLFVIDAIERKTFQTIPRNVASERDFNKIEVDGVDPNHIESGYAHFEGTNSVASSTRKMFRPDQSMILFSMMTSC
ncbi:DUF4238 domain-containing protein [Herbaspirillum sp. HC18]|nr:DUF4238 domain-containing protein [Herbaspirillum sp. HC18]